MTETLDWGGREVFGSVRFPPLPTWDSVTLLLWEVLDHLVVYVLNLEVRLIELRNDPLEGGCVDSLAHLDDDSRSGFKRGKGVKMGVDFGDG